MPPLANLVTVTDRFIAGGPRRTRKENESFWAFLRRAFFVPWLAQPARLELALLDPQLRRDLGIVAAHLLDEPLSVLAADEHLELDAEREVGREGVVDDGVDDHADTMMPSLRAR